MDLNFSPFFVTFNDFFFCWLAVRVHIFGAILFFVRSVFSSMCTTMCRFDSVVCEIDNFEIHVSLSRFTTEFLKIKKKEKNKPYAWWHTHILVKSLLAKKKKKYSKYSEISMRFMHFVCNESNQINGILFSSLSHLYPQFIIVHAYTVWHCYHGCILFFSFTEPFSF